MDQYYLKENILPDLTFIFHENSVTEISANLYNDYWRTVSRLSLFGLCTLHKTSNCLSIKPIMVREVIYMITMVTKMVWWRWSNFNPHKRWDDRWCFYGESCGDLLVILMVVTDMITMMTIFVWWRWLNGNARLRDETIDDDFMARFVATCW